MLYLYLGAAIVGGVLLAGSLIFGGHHGGDVGGEVDTSGAGEHEHGEGLVANAGGFLASLRFWTYFFAMGGAAGAAMRLVAGTGEPLCALLAAAVGATSGLFAHTLMRRLSRDRSVGVYDEKSFQGRSGRLLLPVAPGTLGTVRVEVGQRLVDLTARCEDETLAAREEVLVLEVNDGVALVTRSPDGHR